MKIIKPFLKFSCMTVFCGMLLLACTSDDPETNPEPEILDLATVEGLDSLSDHLTFASAEKIEGKVPSAPAGVSSLKFSIQDTLHLIPGVFMPVKFLHDELTNVAGVYIQVRHFSGSTNLVTEATHYYDVPEVPGTAESDSISVIMVGFDPSDFVDPVGVPPAGAPLPTFEIAITPYDPNGQPLDATVVPVVVEDMNDNDPNGTCGLVLPEGEYWDWSMSYIPSNPWDGDFEFLSSPLDLFKGVQNINGCCGADGNSYYGATCLNLDSTYQRTLPFTTFYLIAHESFIFSDNGTYTRRTQENSANPVPEESNFCDGIAGNVEIKFAKIDYTGNWTVDNVAIPPGYLVNPFFGSITYTTRDRLSLQGTSSTTPGGGFGNPGGIIHLLDCKFGLILIQTDNEGFGQHLYKFYFRRKPGDKVWFPFAFFG